MKNAHKPESFSNDQIAHRKLLQIVAYVPPPTILCVMIAGNKIGGTG